MGKWNLPPSGGHMDLPDGIYLQNMNISEIRERVKKKRCYYHPNRLY